MFNIAVSGWGPITWLPLNPHLENFIYAWNYGSDPPIWRALLNSTVVTLSTTLLVLLISSLTGYALAVYKFRGSRLIFMWILAQIIMQGTTSLFPGTTSLIPMYLLMNWFGWYNTWFSLIIPAAFSAYCIFLMRQYVLTIPDDILDAARLSGCSEFGLYWRMILPLSKPALAAIGLINSVWTWNQFLWPSLMIENTDLDTVTVTLSRVGPYGHGAAVIVLATLPLIIFTVMFQKSLLKGFSGFGYTRR